MMFKLYFFTPLHTFVFLMSEGFTSTVLLLNVDSLINKSINQYNSVQTVTVQSQFLEIFHSYSETDQKHEQKRHGYNNTFIVGINSMGTDIKVSIHFK